MKSISTYLQEWIERLNLSGHFPSYDAMHPSFVVYIM